MSRRARKQTVAYLGGAAAPLPAFSLDFATSKALPSGSTYTRNDTVATYFDSNGYLQVASANAPRFTHDFFSLRSIGYLAEDAATNRIRNNTMQGVAAGTPGTLPTNWTLNLNSNGLSSQVVGSGTERNINYVDIRLFGTTTGAGACELYFEATNSIASANAATWCLSSFLRLVGGDWSNISTLAFDIDQRDASNVFLAFRGGGTNYVTCPAPNGVLRYTQTLVTNQASIAFASPLLRVTPSGTGVAVDITLRIGLPQMEGTAVTSPIKTSGTTAARVVDSCILPTSITSLLTSAAFSVIAKMTSTRVSNYAIIGANSVSYPGFGLINPNWRSSNGASTNVLDAARTENNIYSNTIGLSNGPSGRLLTSNGGTLLSGTTATSAVNQPLGTRMGNASGGGYASAGAISKLDVYNVPLTQGQIESLTSVIANFCIGDSLTDGTGSFSPATNYGYVGFLSSILTKAVARRGYPGQGAAFIASQYLLQTILLGANTFFFVGRNDTGASASVVINAIQSMINHKGSSNYGIIEIINSSAENSAATGANLTNYNWVINTNAAVAAAFPGKIVPARVNLVADSGGANDAPNPLWMYNGSVHPGDCGHQSIAQSCYAYGVAQGWAGYT